MRCPACGAKTDITESRTPSLDRVVRRRKCRNATCGRKFATYEITLDDAERLDLTRQVISDLAQLAGRLHAIAAGTLGHRGMRTPVGMALRSVRVAHGLTVREGAAKAGVPVSSLGFYERVGKPPLPALRKIARGYGLTVVELLAYETHHKEGTEATNAGPCPKAR